MKKFRKLKFTLIEITVAFGILAILLMLLMQFLNTAQKSWNFAERRARAYSDSCVAFEIIERILKNADTSTEAVTIPVANTLLVTAAQPYGAKGYETMEIKNASGVLKINSDELIYNVHSFSCAKLNDYSYIVRLVIFGSEDEYNTYEEDVKDSNNSAYSDDEKEYLAEHSFSFIRIINLR